MSFLRLFRITTRSFSKINYPKAPDSLISSPSSHDTILSKLKSSTNVESLLNHVKEHSRLMNGAQVITSLHTIFDLQRSGNTRLTKDQIKDHPAFLALCRQLKNKSRHISIDEVIEAIKCLNYLSIPADSQLTQILLQMIRFKINELTLSHVIFLDFLLRRLTARTPLLDALKISLPIIFDINVKIQLDRDNIQQVLDALHFSSRNRVNHESVVEIINAILTRHSLNGSQAKSVLWSICDMRPHEDYERIVTESLHVLAQNLSDLSVTDIETTLAKLYERQTTFDFYVNSMFLDACVQYALVNDIGYEKAVWWLNRLNKRNHVSIPLLDYVAQQTMDNPSVLKKTNGLMNSILINSIALADYTNIKNYDTIISEAVRQLENDIFAHKSKSSGLLPSYVHVALNLLSLGIFNEPIVKKAVNIRFENPTYSTKRCLCVIFQASKRIFGKDIQFDDTLLSNMPKPDELEIELPLLRAVETALGGPNYVRSLVEGDLGYSIDHVIVMRKGGYPVAFNDHIPFQGLHLNTIKQEYSDSHIVAIFGLEPFLYASNVHTLRPVYRVLMKVLQSQNITVVPISQCKWNELAEHEKIPYLMQTVNQRIAEDSFDKQVEDTGQL